MNRQFKPVKLTNNVQEDGGQYLLRSTDGEYEIYVMPVIFGYRIVVRQTDSQFYLLNLCAGDEILWIQTLYNMVNMILSNAEDVEQTCRELGHPDIKPYYNDPQWCDKLSTMSKGLEYPSISVINPDHLNKTRDSFFKQLAEMN